jgi:hypothetical protein
MDEDAKPKGRAVAEATATIKTLTLPDGSKRDVAPRPVGDPACIIAWLIRRANENPKMWFDLADLHEFITGAKPMKMTHALTKTMRGYVKAACRFAVHNGYFIETKPIGKQTGATHIRLLDTSSTALKLRAIEGVAAKHRRMENAIGNRVEADCAVLGTDSDQLDAVIAKQNANKAKAEAAAP